MLSKMASADTPSVTVAAGTLPQQPQEPPAVVIAEKVKHMLEACTKGDLATIRALTQEYPILISQQDEGTGISPLMVASQIGNIELVQSLLNEGAPWNAVDRNGKCAGDYSTDAQRWDVVNLLVEWGTRSELILGTTQRMASSSSTTSTPTTSNQQQQQRQQPLEQQPSTKRDYLSHQLRYNADGTALLDQDNDAIMMAWERPIMKAHASVLLGEGEGTGGVRPRQHCRVMNVGFGMGIIDTEIQENYHPSLHIIIEAHPQVYQNMLNLQWDKKPNVQIYHGKWQDVLPKLLQDCDGGSSNNDSNNNNDNNGGGGLSSLDLDAIFYDTYAEHAMDMEDFHSFLPRLLSKRQGIYSFFNGLAPDNLFFHGVACNVVKLQLSQLGFDCDFLQCQIEANNDKVWEGVRRKYWHDRDTYYLPRITWNQEYLGRKNKANGRPVEADESAADMDVEEDQSNFVKRQKMG